MIIDNIQVIFCTHLDIGYTDPPDRVAWRMKEHLDDALRYCREMPDFHYTIETAWVLRQWYERTDNPELIREMGDRIREGRIEACAAFATQHNPICGPEDLNQLCYDSRCLADALGIEIVTAMQDDVPGYVWAHPQIFKKSGIRYFLTGINTLLGGGLALPVAHNPIQWEGIDGSRILTCIRDGYCHWCHKWVYFRNFMEGDSLDAIEANLRLYLDHLAENNYPYDTYCFIANPLDNKGPADNMKMWERMQQWNAEGRSPKFLLTTPRKFFEYMESKYADTFTTYKGDWNPSAGWNMVKTRGPLATSAYRRAQTQLPTAEKLLSFTSLLQNSRFPAPEVREAYDGLLHYGEHSAPEGTGDFRKLTRREVHWGNLEHFNYALRAFNQTETLFEIGLQNTAQWIASSDEPRMIVFNPTSWTRTDVVRVKTGGVGWDSFPEAHQIHEIEDLTTAAKVPCDNTAMSEMGGESCGPDSLPCVAFLAEDIPPMGFRVYRAVSALSGNENTPTETLVSHVKVSIENEKYRVQVCAETGVLSSIYDKQIDREIVAECGKTFDFIDSTTPLPETPITVRIISGKTFQKIEIRRIGSWFPETDFRLDFGVERFEWRNVFDRVAWKNRHPDVPFWRCVTHFPIALNGNESRIVVSGPNGFHRIPEDYLPGSSSDTWPTSAFVSAEADGTSVIIASPTDYLFMEAERSDSYLTLKTFTLSETYGPVHHRLSSKELMSYIEPQGDGRIVHRYALTSHQGGFDASRAQAFGWGFRSELVGVYQPASPLSVTPLFCAPSRSLVKIKDPRGVEGDVSVVIFRRSLFSNQDFFILRLQEMVGKDARSVRVSFAKEFGLMTAAHADMTERKGKEIPLESDGSFSVRIGPFETLTLALGFSR